MPTLTKRQKAALVPALLLLLCGALFSFGSASMTVAQATICRHMISGYEHQGGRLVNTDADLDRAIAESPELFGRDVVTARPRLRLTTENGVRVLTIREYAWPHREYRYSRTSFDSAPN